MQKTLTFLQVAPSSGFLGPVQFGTVTNVNTNDYIVNFHEPFLIQVLQSWHIPIGSRPTVYDNSFYFYSYERSLRSLYMTQVGILLLVLAVIFLYKFSPKFRNKILSYKNRITSLYKVYATSNIIINIFMVTGLITHIWTVIIAFSEGGFFEGILSLILPFLAELYWMFKMFGKLDIYAYISLIHLLLAIPLSLFNRYEKNYE